MKNAGTMKTFSYVYAFMAAATFAGGCMGATHQFYLTALCVVLSVALDPRKRKEKGNEVR